jgi:hypothetical protein
VEELLAERDVEDMLGGAYQRIAHSGEVAVSSVVTSPLGGRSDHRKKREIADRDFGGAAQQIRDARADPVWRMRRPGRDDPVPAYW